jgi:hypothetical protein
VLGACRSSARPTGARFAPDGALADTIVAYEWPRSGPELARALEQMRASDTLLVWRLDRVGRSLSELVGESPSRPVTDRTFPTREDEQQDPAAANKRYDQAGYACLACSCTAFR